MVVLFGSAMLGNYNYGLRWLCSIIPDALLVMRVYVWTCPDHGAKWHMGLHGED